MTHNITRRDFIKQTTCAAISLTALTFPLFPETEEPPPDENRALCIKKFSYAVDNILSRKPMGAIVASIGETFIGTDYQENVLETSDGEHLVVHLQGLDCVTLCENALAFARCIKLNTTNYEAFCKQLEYIRYRAGRIDQYPSRLHYFSDWIFDNEIKGVVKNVTADIGGPSAETTAKRINFMTTHRAMYKQLTDDSFFAEVRQQEEKISARPLRFIPKDRINDISEKIHDGDILAMMTNIEGMDVSHTGIAIRADDGSVHMLHAPVPHTKVQITELGLREYCRKNSRQTGILVARPLDPNRQ